MFHQKSRVFCAQNSFSSQLFFYLVLGLVLKSDHSLFHVYSEIEIIVKASQTITTG